MLFLTFLSLSLLFSFLVISSRNPIHSVLSLVMVFLLASGLVLVSGAEFLALSFVIIYVGAIAILFLFIVMMLDIKVRDKSFTVLNLGPLGYLLGLTFFVQWVVTAIKTLSKLSLIDFSSKLEISRLLDWLYLFNPLRNIEQLGQALYTKYCIVFLMAGFILFVAMIGAIMLTLSCNKTSVKHQSAYQQYSRQSVNSFRVSKTSSK